MATDLGARAELEVEAGPLGELDLTVQLGRLGDQMDTLAHVLRRLEWGLRPRTRKLLSGLHVCTGATYSFVDAGGPEVAERPLKIMRYVVSLNDPSATSTAVAWPFIGKQGGQQDTSVEPATFPDLIDMASTLGSSGNASSTFGEDALTLYYPEHLIFCVKGAANGAQIVVSGQALEVDLDELDDPTQRLARDRVRRHPHARRS